MAMRHYEAVRAAGGPVDPNRTVAVLPLAATEQHGPHLPNTTDTDIAEGMMGCVSACLPAGADVIALPVEAVGASREHERFAGLCSVSTPQLMAQIVARGGDLCDLGVRKVAVISAHGGNVAAMTAATLDLRADFGLLAVATTWMRLGLPDRLIGEAEQAVGIHGGQIETSLMLHFRPERVDMAAARDFPSVQSVLARRYAMLRAHGPIGFGWLAGDLNSDGVVGNAAAATAAIGSAIANHQANRFCRLLAEMADVDLAGLFPDAG